jgi:tRNA(fMet)-specific endonuclease VapC
VLILDTDHFSELLRGSSAGIALSGRLASRTQRPTITIITLEEQARGWLSRIRQAGADQELLLHGYGRLHSLFLITQKCTILTWDEAATHTFSGLSKHRLRIGTMDLRIASIVMANDGTLLSRNLKDFGRISGLRVEDWL